MDFENVLHIYLCPAHLLYMNKTSQEQDHEVLLWNMFSLQDF